MRIIFHDYITDLFVLFAAYLYLIDGNADFETIKKYALRHEDILKQLPGTLITIGKDDLNNSVFIMGRKNEQKIVCQAMMGFSRIFDSEQKFVFFDLSPYRNNFFWLASFMKKLMIPDNIVYKIIFRAIYFQFDDLKKCIKEFSDNVKEQK